MKQVFEVKASAEGLERALLRLKGVRGGIEKATARAVNRSLAAGRTELTRAVRENYTIRARDVRDTISLKKATASDLGGAVKTEGQRLSLRLFKHTPANGETTGAARRQVRVTVKKGGGGPLATGFLWDGGWGTGKSAVFLRLGQKIRPTKGYHKGKGYEVHKLQKAIGPAVPQMAKSDAVRERVQTCLETTFAKRLDHEVDFLLEKRKNK